MGDGNRKERLAALNERSPRVLDTAGSGSIAQDGYRRVYRRPRSTMTDECMSLDQADRVEAFDRDIQGMVAGYDED